MSVEMGMVSDLRLGAFECQLTDASDREKRSKFRVDGSKRPFRGCKLLTLGDFGQLTPLPAGCPISMPQTDTTSLGSRPVLERRRECPEQFPGTRGEETSMMIGMRVSSMNVAPEPSLQKKKGVQTCIADR